MLEKPKLSFGVGSITIKANMELSGKEIEIYPRKFCYLTLKLCSLFKL